MDLVAEVDAVVLAGVEDRPPAPGQFIERRIDQARRALREREQVGPGERAGEGAHVLQAEPARGAGGQVQLLLRPFGAGLRIAAQGFRCEAVAQFIVGRMHGHQLAEDVGGQLADLQAVFGQGAADVVAVVLAVGGGGQVEQARIPGRNLQGLEAVAGRPCGNAVEAVERGLVAGELRQVQAGALEGLHVLLQLFVSRQRIGATLAVVNTRGPGVGQGDAAVLAARL
ncbi:hypothetical protein G6F32_013966 [Rhizopus arrhizus]|nr:hypothetical protein G6F32_013966 [Rhizopus arrhizus]